MSKGPYIWCYVDNDGLLILILCLLCVVMALVAGCEQKGYDWKKDPEGVYSFIECESGCLKGKCLEGQELWDCGRLVAPKIGSTKETK